MARGMNGAASPTHLLRNHSICIIATLDALAAQLGTFLRELHHVPVATAISYQLPCADTVTEWMGIFTRIRTQFPHMRSAMRAQVTHQFESFLHKLHNSPKASLIISSQSARLKLNNLFFPDMSVPKSRDFL